MSEETVISQESDLSGQEEKENPQKGTEAAETPSPLRGTPPLQGESNLPQASSLSPQISTKTQGVKPSRSGAIGVLQSAAKKAAASNSRSDVHEYMRLRRSYV